MIKGEILREFRPTYRYTDPSGITLDNIQSCLQEEADNAGVAIAFRRDQVKSGGMFSKVIEDALIVYNPNHPYDYFNFCIRVQIEGNLAYIIVNDFGTSKQMDKFARSETAYQDRQGKSMSYMVGSMIGSGIRNIGKSKAKLEEEQRYYDALCYVFDQVIS